MTFARVIPVLRTPLGIEGFDYRIPEGQEVKKGDLVSAPFRRGSIVGIVEEVLPTSAFADRAAVIRGSYANLRFPPLFLDLVRTTADRTFSSRPSVLKSWLRDLPKRPPSSNILPSSLTLQGLEAHWQHESTKALLDRASNEAKSRRVLIITPWITRVAFLQQELPHAHVLHSELPAGEAFLQWTQFLSKSNGILIATKIGAWLATMSDLVLLDEPEQDDHKQDELAPRYDARKILLWCAQKGVTRLESFGLTPPLHAVAPAPALEGNVQTYIYHPSGRTSLPFIQADALQTFLDHQGPRIIIHPIRGVTSRIVCRDCHWEAICARCGSGLSADIEGAICRTCGLRNDFPMTCPACGGIALDKSLPGIERIKSRWQKEYPHEAVEWRDITAEQLEAPLPQGAIVLLTDAALLGVGEDIRRRERQCIAFRRLADRVAAVGGTFLVQCRESFFPSLEAWMTTEGMRLYVEQEREERRAFAYPPTTRLVKVIFRGSPEEAERWQTNIQTTLQTSPLREATWRGPLPVERQAKTRGSRVVFHLLFPADISESLLIAHLRPLINGRIVIDLDPIAFLR